MTAGIETYVGLWRSFLLAFLMGISVAATFPLAVASPEKQVRW